jgi:hypothetical protein
MTLEKRAEAMSTVGLARASPPIASGLRGECQAFRVRPCQRVRRGVAPGGSVLATAVTCTLRSPVGAQGLGVRIAAARGGELLVWEHSFQVLQLGIQS